MVEPACTDIYGSTRTLKQLVSRKTVDEKGNQKEKEEIKVYNLPSEPPFVKMYLADILYLKDMPRGLNPILHILLKNIQWGSNQLILNASLKKRMAQEIDLKVSTIEKAITQFVKANILHREDKGIYTFNPYLFGCGYWNDIQQIRTTIVYDLNGRTFQSNLTKNEDFDEEAATSELTAIAL